MPQISPFSWLLVYLLVFFSFMFMNFAVWSFYLVGLEYGILDFDFSSDFVGVLNI